MAKDEKNTSVYTNKTLANTALGRTIRRHDLMNQGYTLTEAHDIVNPEERRETLQQVSSLLNSSNVNYLSKEEEEKRRKQLEALRNSPSVKVRDYLKEPLDIAEAKINSASRYRSYDAWGQGTGDQTYLGNLQKQLDDLQGQLSKVQQKMTTGSVAENNATYAMEYKPLQEQIDTVKAKIKNTNIPMPNPTYDYYSKRTTEQLENDKKVLENIVKLDQRGANAFDENGEVRTGSIEETLGHSTGKTDDLEIVNKLLDERERESIYEEYAKKFDDENYDGTFDWKNNDPMYLMVNGKIKPETSGAALYMEEAQFDELTDSEKKLFNSIWKNEGKAQAWEYYEFLQRDLNFRDRIKHEEYARRFAEENPVLASVASVGQKMVAPITLMRQLQDSLDGKEIDQNASYYSPSYLSTAMRNEISNNILNEHGAGASRFYQTIMSVADNVAQMLSTGGTSEAAILGLMASDVFVDSIVEAKDAGKSDSEVIMTSTARALIELATEKAGLDEVFKVTKGAGFKQLLKAMFAEGAEEGASNIANLLFDMANASLHDRDNDLKKDVEKYIALGFSESEAMGMVFQDRAEELGLDIIGGAFSGLLLSGGSYMASTGAKLASTTVREQIDLGKTFDSDSEAYKHAEMMEKNENKLTRELQKLKQIDLNNEQEVKAFKDYSEQSRKALQESTSETINDITEELLANARNDAERAAAASECLKRFGEIELKEIERTNATVDTAKGSELGQILRLSKPTIRTNTGEIVRMEDVEFESGDRRTLYENAVKDLRKTSDANDYIGAYDSALAAQAYDTVFKTAYKLGSKGINSIEKILSNESVSAVAELYRDVDLAPIINIAMKDGFNSALKVTEGEKSLISTVAKALDVEVEFLDYLTDENGDAIQGRYINGKIQISTVTRNPATFVFCHELTHAMEDKNPNVWKLYKDKIITQLKSEGRYDNMVEEVKRVYGDSTTEEIESEIVAIASETYLVDKVFVDSLKENKALFKRLRNIIVTRLKRVGLDSFRNEMADATRDDSEFFKKIGELWYDIATEKEFTESELSEMREEILQQKSSLPTEISEDSREELEEKGVVAGDSYVVKNSLEFWNETDKSELKQSLIEAGFEADEIDRWIGNVNSVAASIFADRSRLDYDADKYQSAIKSNSEYYYTLDLSTLCKKRLLYQGTYNAIMHRIIDVPLLAEDTIRLRQLMDKHGYEVPCGICYEESRKKHEGLFAQRWLEGYGKWEGYKNQKHDDPYIPKLDEVTSTDGRAKLREEHPEALESYLNYQKTRGNANPKVSLTHTEYRRDIMRLSDGDIKKVKHIGGLRIQSFSDFETIHTIDMMQAVLDMAIRKLTAQAYTKVPAFADIFGGTGIKINLSLIGEVNENGELVFNAKEGIDPDEAFRLREKYSDNVGTILVGANDASILSAWADPRIDMVIPFHKSGWADAEYEQLGIKGYKNYESYQTEKYMLNGKWVSLSKANEALNLTGDDKLAEIFSEDYWEDNRSGKENAEAYLALCAEKGYRPVFYNFLHDNGDGTWSLKEDGSTDGYWKSLVDYKMYNNEGFSAPQQEVRPVFDMDAAQRNMEKFDGDPNTLPVAWDVVDEFVNEFNRGKIQYSREFEEEDSNGVPLTKEQSEFYRYSKARNRSGKLANLFHSTNKGGFMIFDPSFSDDELSLFFSSSPWVSRTYAQNPEPMYPYHIEDYDSLRKYVSESPYELLIIPKKEYEKVIGEYIADERTDAETYDGFWEAYYNEDNAFANGLFGINKEAENPLDEYEKAIEENLINPNDYYLVLELPSYSGKDGVKNFAAGKDVDSLIKDAKFGYEYGMEKAGSQHAIYSVYLNLTNPLILETHGSEWYSIGVNLSKEQVELVSYYKVDHFEVTFKDGDEKHIHINIRYSVKDENGNWVEDHIEDDIFPRPDTEHWGMDEEETILIMCDDARRFIKKYMAPHLVYYFDREYSDGDWTDDILFDGDEPLYFMEDGQKIEEDVYMDTREVAQMAYDSGYDGVIFRDLVDLASTTNYLPSDSGESDIYIAFFSEQVKSTYNKQPTWSRDYRYAREFENQNDVDTELLHMVTDVLSQVDVSDIKLTDEQVTKIAKRVKRGLGSEYSTEELATNLKRALAYWTEHKNVDFNALTQIMNEIMIPVVNQIYDYSNDTRRRLLVRNKTFIISTETAEKFGGVLGLNQRLLKYGVAFTTNENYIPPDRRIVEDGEVRLEPSKRVVMRLIDNWANGDASGIADDLNIDTQITDESDMVNAMLEYLETEKRNARVQAIPSDMRETFAYNLTLKAYEEFVGESRVSIRDVNRRTNDLVQKKAAQALEEIRGEYVNQFLNMLAEGEEAIRAEKDKIKERAEKAKYFEMLRKEMKRFEKLATRPSRRKHFDFDYMKYIGAIGSMIDLTTNRRISSQNNALIELSKEYKRLASIGMYQNGEYDTTIEELIYKTGQLINGRKIRELNSREIKQVFEAVRAFIHAATNLNNFIDLDEIRDIYDATERTISDINEAEGSKAKGFGHLSDSFVTISLNPQREIDRIIDYHDDNPLHLLTDKLVKGEVKVQQYKMEISNIFSEMDKGQYKRGSKAYNRAKEFKKRYEKMNTNYVEVQLGGETRTISEGQLLALVMHARNEDNMRHVLYGGVLLPESKLYKNGQYAEAYQRGEIVVPTADEVNALSKNLDEYQKWFLNKNIEYFEVYAKNLINSTSLKLEGFARAEVENYYPIRVDENHVNAKTYDIATGMESTGESLNSGMLMARTKSKKAIYLNSITQDLMRSQNFVSRYAALAIPLRDFNRIYNSMIDGKTALKDAIGRKWGSNAIQYIDNMLRDLTEGRSLASTKFEKAMDKVRTLSAQAVLTINPSVSIKQSASYPTAIAELDYKSVMRALVNPEGNSFILKRADQELIARYSPILWSRMAGMSTQEVAELQMERHKNPIDKGIEKLPFLTDWIRKVDVATVGRLWYATQYWVDDHYKNLEKGSDEYYKKVAEKFEDVVLKTQPNYTVMTRPEALRTKNALLKAVFMFKTQPMQNFGILYDATARLNAKQRQYNKAKGTPMATPALSELRDARAKWARAVTSQLLQTAVFTGMTFVANALILHRWDKYKDEKINEITFTSVIEQMLWDYADSFFGNTIIVDNIEDIAAFFVRKFALKEDVQYYGVSVFGIDNINDISDIVTKMAGYIQEGETEKALKTAKTFAEKIAQLSGIPAENIDKLIRSVWEYSLDFAQNRDWTALSGTAAKHYWERIRRSYNGEYNRDYSEIFDEMLNDENVGVKKARGVLSKDDKTGIMEWVSDMYVNGTAEQKRMVEDWLEDLYDENGLKSKKRSLYEYVGANIPTELKKQDEMNDAEKAKYKESQKKEKEAKKKEEYKVLAPRVDIAFTNWKSGKKYDVPIKKGDDTCSLQMARLYQTSSDKDAVKKFAVEVLGYKADYIDSTAKDWAEKDLSGY